MPLKNPQKKHLVTLFLFFASLENVRSVNRIGRRRVGLNKTLIQKYVIVIHHRCLSSRPLLKIFMQQDCFITHKQTNMMCYPFDSITGFRLVVYYLFTKKAMVLFYYVKLLLYLPDSLNAAGWKVVYLTSKSPIKVCFLIGSNS